METSDNELIQRILSGDCGGFDELVVRHRKRVYATAYRMVRNHEAAEEIAQETFLRVFRNLHSFRRKASFTTWLYRITMNLCLNQFRQKDLHDDSDVEAADASPTAVEKMAEQERRLWLEREIQALPPKQKSVLVLRIYNDLSFKDIGHIIGCTAGSAKVNYRHAVLKLKEKFNNFSEEL